MQRDSFGTRAKSLAAIAITAIAIVAARFDCRAEASRAPRVGDVVANWTANDIYGRSYQLPELSRNRVVVLAFLGVDCPLANLYAPRLAELSKLYSTRGAEFFGIDSNCQDSIAEMTAFVRRHAIPFPMLKDLKQQIADQVGATRTPQVIVFDRERRIRFRGRIDDQYGFVSGNRRASYRKPKADYRDLALALDAILANKPVDNAESEAVGCLISRDRPPVAHPTVTYTKDVAPILNTHCVVCHRPKQIAPFALTSFQEAAGWAEMIAEVTQSGRMPPWHADPRYGHFANDARLSDSQKQILADWAASGAPEGNPNDLPPSPEFIEGWMIPEPDQIFSMSEQPFPVPATGVVELQQFLVDPDWKADQWIAAIEPRPGNPAVVHHILIFILPPEGGTIELRSDDFYAGAYAAGMRPVPFPRGYALLAKAGSKIFFNVHYTPNGSPQEDRSYVGIKFADPKSVTHEVSVSSAMNLDFSIPSGAANYEVRSSYTFKRDSLLLTLIPHMHLRGKDFLYEAAYPDGNREVLLSVPHYDFGWQTNYRLTEPKRMPKGTVLNCIAHFDNSPENPNNPDPNATVRFGWQSFEEMMIGFFEQTPAAGLSHGWNWNQLKRFNPTEAQLLIVLTIVNGALVTALLFREMRRSKNNRRNFRDRA
jgi:peroxiredoxin